MTSPFNPLQLQRGLAALGLSPSPQQCANLIRYCELLEHTNRSLNLTRVPPENYVTLHLLDALSIVRVVDPGSLTSMIDAGTGAGVPGVPLSILYPQLSVLMIDATRKKLTFIESVLAELKLTNGKVLHSRLEPLASDPRLRERSPLVVARALAPLKELAGWLLPLTALGGSVVAYKGPGAKEEIESAASAIAEFGGAIATVDEFRLPESDVSRTLIVIKKTAPSKAPGQKPGRK